MNAIFIGKPDAVPAEPVKKAEEKAPAEKVVKKVKKAKKVARRKRM